MPKRKVDEKIVVIRGHARRLNGGQIEAKLNKLESQFPNFKSFGATSPSQQFTKGIQDMTGTTKTVAAMVMNTDDSGEGEHWFAILFEKEGTTIEVFDPFGVKFCELAENVRTAIGKINVLFPERQVDSSTMEHQKNTTMCGMYCAYFIEQRLKGQSMANINANRITDQDMAILRNQWFDFRVVRRTGRRKPDEGEEGSGGGKSWSNPIVCSDDEGEEGSGDGK